MIEANQIEPGAIVRNDTGKRQFVIIRRDADDRIMYSVLGELSPRPRWMSVSDMAALGESVTMVTSKNIS